MAKPYQIWDDIDRDNDLRENLARIIASKVSGLPPNQLTPVDFDYELADEIGVLVDKRYHVFH